MAHSSAHDAGSATLTRPAAASIAVTAAGSGDSTTAVGYAVDTSPQTLGARYNAATLHIANLSTQASGNNIAVKALIEQSTNNSDWTTLVATQTVYSQTATGGALTAAHSGGKVVVPMDRAARYIRATLVPDMSATGTDTAVVSSVWVLAHPDRSPAAS